MKIDIPDHFAGPIPRKDIIAICVYLNRANGTKAVDSCVGSQGEFLQRLTDAARMQ